jgi:hypothetical protein
VSAKDLDYGLELLGKAVALGTDGVAATDDGGPDRRRRIVRALIALEKQGLADVVRVAGEVVGAEFTEAGSRRGRAIAETGPAPNRISGDVVDVSIVLGDGIPDA